MTDLNPYMYGTVEYYEHEMNAARRNLNLVVSGGVQDIKDCDLHNEQHIIISDCAAIVRASEQYKSAVKRYDEAKAKEDKPDE